MTIHHRPACGAARHTMALIRNAGVKPVVIDYMQTPPDRATRVNLIAKSGLAVRQQDHGQRVVDEHGARVQHG